MEERWGAKWRSSLDAADSKHYRRCLTVARAAVAHADEMEEFEKVRIDKGLSGLVKYLQGKGYAVSKAKKQTGGDE